MLNNELSNSHVSNNKPSNSNMESKYTKNDSNLDEKPSQQKETDLDVLESDDIPDLDFDIITNQIAMNHGMDMAKLPSLHELVSVLLWHFLNFTLNFVPVILLYIIFDNAGTIEFCYIINIDVSVVASIFRNIYVYLKRCP